MKKAQLPAFTECIRRMHKHDPQTREEGFAALLPHAHEYVDQLMAEFRTETDHGLRCWLLELIGEARSPVAYPLLVEHLHSDDDSLGSWAIYGLRSLGTKEARRALWNAGVGEEVT